MIKPVAKNKNPDKSIETVLSILLRTGVIIAGTIVLIGGVLFLVNHGLEIPGYHTYEGDTSNLSGFRNFLTGILAFRSASIMELGILLLIATPVLRVLFSVFAFAFEKDYMYVVFTLIVLLVLVYSFFS